MAKTATKVAVAPVKLQVVAAKAAVKTASKVSAVPFKALDKITPKPLKSIVKIATAPARLAVTAPLKVAGKSLSLTSKIVNAATPGKTTAAPKAAMPKAVVAKASAIDFGGAVVRGNLLPSLSKVVAAASPASVVAMDPSPPAPDEPLDVTPAEPAADPYAAPDDGSDAHAPAPANFDGSPHADSGFEAGPPDDSGAADYEGAEVEHEEGDPMALGDIDYAAAFAGIDDVDNSAQLYGLGDWKADLKNIGKSAAQGAAITGGTAALNLAVAKLQSSPQAAAIAAAARGAAGAKPVGMTSSTKLAIGAAVALPVLYLLTHHKAAS